MSSFKEPSENTLDISNERDRRDVRACDDSIACYRRETKPDRSMVTTRSKCSTDSLTSPNIRIILGVDPGTIVTGYAVIKIGTPLQPLDFGCIRPPKNALLSERYHVIFQSLHHIIHTHGVTEMAIETPFINKNPQSALKLGSALGCAIIAAKEHNLRVFGYSPRQVKQGITGLGSATKDNVEAFLRALLHLRNADLQPDTSDALSIAVHHANASPIHPPKEL
jgi:crossover junction endodeoxyribonuclease RuvC